MSQWALPPTIAKYALKGTLHGNHSMSLSRGFVKCNIIQGGRDARKKETFIHHCRKILLLSVLCPPMSLIQMNARSMAAGYRFSVWSGHFIHGSYVLRIFPVKSNRQVLPDLSEKQPKCMKNKAVRLFKNWQGSDLSKRKTVIGQKKKWTFMHDLFWVRIITALC